MNNLSRFQATPCGWPFLKSCELWWCKQASQPIRAVRGDAVLGVLLSEVALLTVPGIMISSPVCSSRVK
jgi:hypothetical protein